MLSDKIKSVVRDVPDFPKEGIIFKDITPLFQNALLIEELANAIADFWKDKSIDAIAGIESRGFLLGPMVATKLGIPFVPIRKKGKLPYKTIGIAYDLEYGQAEIEMHIDAVKKNQNILIHDDLLATGGTADATAKLMEKAGAKTAGFSFIISLDFLNGEQQLTQHSKLIHSLTNY